MLRFGRDRDKIHPADGTAPGMILNDLGVHGAGIVQSRSLEGDQVHAADRARARTVLNDLRMHRATIGNLRSSVDRLERADLKKPEHAPSGKGDENAQQGPPQDSHPASARRRSLLDALPLSCVPKGSRVFHDFPLSERTGPPDFRIRLRCDCGPTGRVRGLGLAPR